MPARISPSCLFAAIGAPLGAAVAAPPQDDPAPERWHAQDLVLVDTAFLQEVGTWQFTLSGAGLARSHATDVGLALDIEYGLTEWLQIEADVPYRYLKEDHEQSHSGLSDVSLGLLIGLIRADSPITLSAGFTITLPTASGDLGDDSVSIEPEILAAWDTGLVIIHSTLGFELASGEQALDYGIALEYPMEGVSGMIEFSGTSGPEPETYASVGMAVGFHQERGACRRRSHRRERARRRLGTDREGHAGVLVRLCRGPEMRSTRTTSIRRRVLLSFLTVAAMVPLVGGISTVFSWMAAAHVSGFQADQLQTVDALRQARESALAIRIGVAELARVVEASPARPGPDREEAARLASDVRSTLDTLGRAAQAYAVHEDIDQAALVNRLHACYAALRGAADAFLESIEAYENAGTIPSSDRLASLHAAQSDFELMSHEIAVSEDAELEEFSGSMRALIGRGLLVNVGVTLLSCLAAVAIAARVSRSITRPLAALTRAVEEFSKGRLDSKIGIESSDELGLLAQRMREMSTNLVVSQRERDEARQEAEGASRAKSEFLANMSHEIRTPMTAILGYAETLQTDEQTDLERAECVRVIRRNGDHLLQVINDILDLSKIEAGRIGIARDRCSLCRIVTEVAAMMRIRAMEKGLSLEVEYVFPVPESIESDTLRVRQILVNLVGNAVKFTETGSVRLRVRSESAAHSVFIDVIDTGIGIDAVHLPLLFGRSARRMRRSRGSSAEPAWG